MVNYDKSLVKGGFTKKYYKGLIWYLGDYLVQESKLD
jgi:hypothetical protein